jgi:hypothetical protein
MRVVEIIRDKARWPPVFSFLGLRPGNAYPEAPASDRVSFMSRSRRKQIEGHNTYFATCTVVGRLHLFTKPDLAEAVLNSLKFLQEENRLALHAYVEVSAMSINRIFMSEETVIAVTLLFVSALLTSCRDQELSNNRLISAARKGMQTKIVSLLPCSLC